MMGGVEADGKQHSSGIKFLELDAGLENRLGFLRQMTQGLEEEGQPNLIRAAANRWVGLAKARGLDNKDKDAAKIYTEILAAAKEGKALAGGDGAAYDLDATVKANLKKNTPKKKGEDPATLEKRVETEAVEITLEDLLSNVTSNDRAYFLGRGFFLDPALGTIESAEKRAKRAKLWRLTPRWTCPCDGTARTCCRDARTQATSTSFINTELSRDRSGARRLTTSDIINKLNAKMEKTGELKSFAGVIAFVARVDLDHNKNIARRIEPQFLREMTVKMALTHWNPTAVSTIQAWSNNGWLSGHADEVWSTDTLHERLKNLDITVAETEAATPAEATARLAQGGRAPGAHGLARRRRSALTTAAAGLTDALTPTTRCIRTSQARGAGGRRQQAADVAEGKGSAARAEQATAAATAGPDAEAGAAATVEARGTERTAREATRHRTRVVAAARTSCATGARSRATSRVTARSRGRAARLTSARRRHERG
jgi:hypothetical protein